MIEIGVEQRLGRKCFLLLLFRKASIAVGLTLASIVLLALSGTIIPAVVRLSTLGSQATADTVGPISSAFSFIVSGCFLLGVMLFLVSYIVSRLEYNNFTFNFGEFDLHLSRGIIDRKETSVPYRQIQDVNIERNLDHQLMGLSKIVITTAGHEETEEKGMSEIVLDPLDKSVAEEIRTLLERKIGVQVVEDQTVADKEAQPQA